MFCAFEKNKCKKYMKIGKRSVLAIPAGLGTHTLTRTLILMQTESFYSIPFCGNVGDAHRTHN